MQHKVEKMSHEGESGGQQSVTTISTVAVQAGKSRITIAVLKCGALIQLQLVDSDPGLLEIGNDQEETRRLLDEHEQLLNKLKKCEGCVWDLLREVDKTEDEGDVHNAMADSLSCTWRGLAAHLEKRRELLHLAFHFFDQALEFSIKIDEAEELLVKADNNRGRSEDLLRRHSCIKRGLLEKSMRVLNNSQELLDFLKDLGSLADLAGPDGVRRARSSCMKVEHLVEILQDRRRQVDQQMSQQQRHLEVILRVCQWERQEQEVTKWFREDARVFLGKGLLGGTLSENGELIQEYRDFQRKAKDWCSLAERLMTEASEILSGQNEAESDSVAAKSREMKDLLDEHRRLMESRLADLQEGHGFFSSASKAFEVLVDIERQAQALRSQPVGLPQLAQQHKQLQGTAAEATDEPLKRGRALLQRLCPHRDQVAGVQRMLGHLQERVESLIKECHTHEELAGKKSHLVSSIEEIADKVSVWVQSTSSTLSRSVELGPALSQSEDVLNTHLELVSQVQDMAGELSHVTELVTELRSLQSPEADELSVRSSLLGEELRSLERSVVARLEILRPYVCFLRSAEEVNKQLQCLQETYRTRPEEQTDEQAGTGAKEAADTRWQSMLEKFVIMQDQGNGFISFGSMVSASLSLDVRAAMHKVEKTMEELSKKKVAVMDLWTSWQLQISQMMSVKKQWKKFKEHLKKIAHDLKIVEDVLAPVSKMDLGNDLKAVAQLQEKFNQAKPQLLQLNAEVEYMVTVSELLVRRGIPVKEKNEKVTELLHLHQRVKDKIREYGMVINMAVRFLLLCHELENTSSAALAASIEERRGHVHHLYMLAISLGSEVISVVQQSHALSFRVQQLQEKLERLEKAGVRWSAETEHREESLLSTPHYCVLKEEVSELRESFKDLKKKFNNLKFNYMKRNEKTRNIKAVKNQIQQIEFYTEKLQVLQKRMQAFTVKVSNSTEKHLVGKNRRDMEDDMNELLRQLGDFDRTVEDYKIHLNMMVKLQQAVEEYQFWCDEVTATIVRVGKFSSECKTKEAVEVLYKQFEKFVWPAVPQQEERIQEITELAIRLHGPKEGKKIVEKTITKHKEITDSIKELCNGLMDLEAKLQAETLKVKAERPEDNPKQTTRESLTSEISELKESGHTPEHVGPGHDKPSGAQHPENTRYQEVPAGPTTETTCHTSEEYLETSHMTSASDGCAAEWREQLHVVSHAEMGEISHPAAEIMNPDTTQDTSVCLSPSGEGMGRAEGDLLTEESLSNDEYECTSPDDMSLPPLSETPDSNAVQSLNDLDDGMCFGSQSPHVSQNPDGGPPQDAPHRRDWVAGQDESQPSPPGGPGTRFRVESSSFVHSPLTVPAPCVVSNTLSSILKSRFPPSVATPLGTLSESHQTLYAVHESFMQTQEYVHAVPPQAAPSQRSNTHDRAPPLTSELEPGICKPTAVREEVRLSPAIGTVPSLSGQAPNFSKLLSNAKVMEGSPVTLEVEVVGAPEPTLTWYKNGQKVTSDEHITLSQKDGKHALFIQTACSSDAGLYVARAINSSGTLSSSAALQVKVQGRAPHFLRGLQDEVLLAGEDLFLECVIYGRPTPRVLWEKDGAVVACGESRFQNQSDSHVLLKRHVGLSDSGKYVCVARNEEGEASCSAQIHVVELSLVATGNIRLY